MAQTNSWKRLTASGAVITGAGILSGMYVTNTSSATMILYHGTTTTNTGTPLGGTITPAAGYHDLGNIQTTAGVYCYTYGGAIDVRFHIKDTD